MSTDDSTPELIEGVECSLQRALEEEDTREKDFYLRKALQRVVMLQQRSDRP